MAYPTLAELYPNISDLHLNLAFSEPYSGKGMHTRSLNRLCQFWNLLGARSMSQGNHCVKCGAAYTRKHRKNKNLNLCTKHLKSYVAQHRREQH